MDELKTLTEQARKGNVEAYGALVERFQEMAVGYAHSMLGDFHLAEDIAQEAFIQAYLKLDQLEEPLAFASWLRRILFTHCDRVTRRKKQPVVDPEAADRIAADDRSPAARLEVEESEEKLQQALLSLPDAEREITRLFYINSFTQREIAAYLDIPVTTVNYRLHAARKRLKQEMLEMTATNERKPADSGVIAAKVQDKIKTLEHLHAELADAMKPVFSVAMNRLVEIEVQSVDQPIYGAFIENLPRHSCTYYFNMDPMSGWVTWNLSMPLVMASQNRFHDGEELAQEVENRSAMPTDLLWITPYHLGLLNQLIRLIILNLENAWKPVLPVEVTGIEIETTPRLLLKDARLTDEEETVVQIDLEVKVPGLSGLIMSLCYPVAMLERALPDAGA